MSRSPVWAVALALLSAAVCAQQLPKLPDKLPGVINIPHLTKGPVTTVTPVYPEDARQHWADGTVVLDVVLSESGQVEQLGCDHICAAERPDFVQSAADAIRQWRWDPVLIKGKAVRVRTRVSIPFLLDEKTPPVSACSVIKDPKAFVDHVVNLYGTVTVLDRTRLLGSKDCQDNLSLVDNSELTPPTKDSKFVAFQEALSMGPAPVAVRGLVRVDKSPGYHPGLQIILERVLRNGN